MRWSRPHLDRRSRVGAKHRGSRLPVIFRNSLLESERQQLAVGLKRCARVRARENNATPTTITIPDVGVESIGGHKKTK